MAIDDSKFDSDSTIPKAPGGQTQGQTAGAPSIMSDDASGLDDETLAASEPKSNPSLRGAATDAAGAVKGQASTFAQQAADKARSYAFDSKAKASGALNDVSRMIEDAAATVDEKVGAQYGDYARTAATMVSGFATRLDEKDVEELIDDARVFVRKSPAVAIGAAAAVGFVVARLVKNGLDGVTTGSTTTGTGGTGSTGLAVVEVPNDPSNTPAPPPAPTGL